MSLRRHHLLKHGGGHTGTVGRDVTLWHRALVYGGRRGSFFPPGPADRGPSDAGGSSIHKDSVRLRTRGRAPRGPAAGDGPRSTWRPVVEVTRSGRWAMPGGLGMVRRWRLLRPAWCATQVANRFWPPGLAPAQGRDAQVVREDDFCVRVMLVISPLGLPGGHQTRDGVRRRASRTCVPTRVRGYEERGCGVREIETRQRHGAREILCWRSGGLAA
jgi:hypothetical protein